MEPLLKQLRQLPAKFATLPAGVRWAAVALVLGSILVGSVVAFGRANEDYRYAFTNLSPEDSAEAITLLTGAGIPNRVEANGAAVAVPADRVYDVRLLLAAAGLPRGGGVGFELFDKADLGQSEFTKKVNLGRALEGELVRTISRLTEVRSARVHLTLGEKGLFRDEDRKASAAVVVNLKAGTSLEERELAGIRHLVASAVPGLIPEEVTIVDGTGAVLTTQETPGQEATSHQRQMEQDLEHRLVTLLEPVVGHGAVVARVTAQLDDAEVSTKQELVDPDQAAVVSEHHMTQANQQDNAGSSAAGAASVTTSTDATPAAMGPKSSNSTDDQTKTYEVSRTVTTTLNRAPRLKRLSVALLLDGVDGKPRPDADVTRLGELAKRAVGFEAQRGDQFQISSAVFTKSTEEAAAPLPADPFWVRFRTPILGVIAGLFLLPVLLFVWRVGLWKPASSTSRSTEIQLLRPGVSIADAEAALSQQPFAAALPPRPRLDSGPDPAAAVRDRARELAAMDPTRATYLMRAWITSDQDSSKEPANA